MTYPEPYGLECGAGWKDIIDRTHEKLKYIDPDYTIAQIKEKFGGLRYYFDASVEYGSVAYDIMNDIVKAAEHEASYTCELCGVQGISKGVETRVDHYWYYTYCKECSDNHIAKRNERFGSKND